MIKVVIDIEPELDIREAAEGEEGFDVPDNFWLELQRARVHADGVETAILRRVISAYPNHPDVGYLVEYLKEDRDG